MIKPHIVFDDNNLSKKIKNFWDKNLSIYSISKSNLIIVIGGDGFMLWALKKYRNTNKSSKYIMLADTKDLKSLPFWECQFESGRGHH